MAHGLFFKWFNGNFRRSPPESGKKFYQSWDVFGFKTSFFLSVFRKICELLFIRGCFCGQHFTISWYIGAVAIVNIDLQASWLSFCLTRRIYISLLSADCEIAVKAFVIIVCDLYCKDSSVIR